MPPKRKSTSSRPAKRPRRTNELPALIKQSSKLQLDFSNLSDPIVKLDDLCLDLIFQNFNLKDLIVVSTVSKLWSIRSMNWIMSRIEYLKKLGLTLPAEIGMEQDTSKRCAMWRRCASGHVRRVLARPLKAIKVKNISRKIFDISGPYIAWVELEMVKFKYKWAEAYVEDGYLNQQESENACICLQRPVDLENPNAPVPKPKGVRLKSILTKQIGSGRNGNYTPCSLKIWTSNDRLRVIGALDMYIQENPSGSYMNGRGHIREFITVFIDLLTFQVLWKLEHGRNASTNMTIYENSQDSAVSSNGCYAVLRRGTLKPNSQSGNNDSEIRVYNILTGELIFKNDHILSPVYAGWDISGLLPEHSVSHFYIHPRHDIVFFQNRPSNHTMEHYVVTPTGQHRLPTLPLMKFTPNINSPAIPLKDMDGNISHCCPSFLYFDSTLSMNSPDTFHICDGHSSFEQSNQFLCFQFWFTYQLPDNPTLATADDWANVKLIQIRAYNTPKFLTRSGKIAAGVNPELNQSFGCTTGYHASLPLCIYSWGQVKDKGGCPWSVDGSTKRSEDKKIAVDCWELMGEDGVTITTRRAPKKKGRTEGENGADLTERRKLNVTRSYGDKLSGKLGRESAAWWERESESVLAMFF